MKRIKSIWLVMSIIASLTISSCCITRGQKISMDYVISAGDSIASATIGDSIYSIIASAGNVKVTDLSISLPEGTPKELSLESDAAKSLMFLMCNPDNYVSDTPVYGIFNPSLVYTFTKGKRSASVAYDFGLRKWAVRDAENRDIIIRDLRQGDDLLRLARILFPSDPLLKSIEEK